MVVRGVMGEVMTADFSGQAEAIREAPVLPRY